MAPFGLKCLNHPVFFMVLMFNVSGSNFTSIYTVTVSESLVLHCGEETNVPSKWTHSGKVIYYHNFFLNDQFEQHMQVFENYSILITAVSVYHDGKYQCIRESMSVAEYFVGVEGLLHCNFSLYNATCDISQSVINQLNDIFKDMISFYKWVCVTWKASSLISGNVSLCLWVKLRFCACELIFVSVLYPVCELLAIKFPGRTLIDYAFFILARNDPADLSEGFKLSFRNDVFCAVTHWL